MWVSLMVSMKLSEILNFFVFAEEKGLLKSNTARSNKAVVMRVCSVLDEDEQNHMSQLTPDEIYQRFKTKYAADLSVESLRVYKSRFLSAIEIFKEWQQQESTHEHIEENQEETPNLLIDQYKKFGNLKRLVLTEVPVAMGDGSVVKIINLPQDLSFKEAERLKRIIDAYVRVM